LVAVRSPGNWVGRRAMTTARTATIAARDIKILRIMVASFPPAMVVRGDPQSTRHDTIHPTRRRDPMAKTKHIALSTQDVDKTAAFYINVFGMKEIARIDSPNARGYYLSDGDLNLAILNFKNDAVAGVERGKEWSGIHHIGFQVESLEAIAEKLAAVGAEPRHDINEALGVGHGHQKYGNGEVKYSGPDGVMVDVSETGWVGTSGFSV